ncbi:MAG TPA: CsbD family protein [Anaerolineae bacterium]|nr:CsbD family protein [Anaerolineae bacterium]
MNADVLQGRWDQIRGDAKHWWGQLTDDDLDRVGGEVDRLVGVLQEKYGYTKERARQEVDRYLRQYNMQLRHMAEALPENVRQVVTQNPWLPLVGLVVLGLAIALVIRATRGQ